MTSITTASGTVWAVFGHRLALDCADTKILVDLGPKGAEGLTLAPGDAVIVEGERTPCEIRAARLVLADGTVRTLARPGRDHGPGDLELALRRVRDAGYHVEGAPIRKPRHFELVGIRDGASFQVHVHDDGSIRKAKPLAV